MSKTEKLNSPQKKHSLAMKLFLSAVVTIGIFMIVGIITAVIFAGSLFHYFDSSVKQSNEIASRVHDKYQSFVMPNGWQLMNEGKNADAIDVAKEDTGWVYMYKVPNDGSTVIVKQYEQALDTSLPGFTYKISQPENAYEQEQLVATNPEKNLRVEASLSSTRPNEYSVFVTEFNP